MRSIGRSVRSVRSVCFKKIISVCLKNFVIFVRSVCFKKIISVCFKIFVIFVKFVFKKIS